LAGGDCGLNKSRALRLSFGRNQIHVTTPPAALENLFKAFYTTKPNGLGLGLSICPSIIEAQGGRLWESGNASRGAVFQFTLPGHSDVASRQ
jgi:signal transduction histidine kinase